MALISRQKARTLGEQGGNPDAVIAELGNSNGYVNSISHAIIIANKDLKHTHLALNSGMEANMQVMKRDYAEAGRSITDTNTHLGAIPAGIRAANPELQQLEIERQNNQAAILINANDFNAALGILNPLAATEMGKPPANRSETVLINQGMAAAMRFNDTGLPADQIAAETAFTNAEAIVNAKYPAGHPSLAATNTAYNGPDGIIAQRRGLIGHPANYINGDQSLVFGHVLAETASDAPEIVTPPDSLRSANRDGAIARATSVVDQMLAHDRTYQEMNWDHRTMPPIDRMGHGTELYLDEAKTYRKALIHLVAGKDQLLEDKPEVRRQLLTDARTSIDGLVGWQQSDIRFLNPATGEQAGSQQFSGIFSKSAEINAELASVLRADDKKGNKVAINEAIQRSRTHCNKAEHIVTSKFSRWDPAIDLTNSLSIAASRYSSEYIDQQLTKGEVLVSGKRQTLRRLRTEEGALTAVDKALEVAEVVGGSHSRLAMARLKGADVYSSVAEEKTNAGWFGGRWKPRYRQHESVAANLVNDAIDQTIGGVPGTIADPDQRAAVRHMAKGQGLSLAGQLEQDSVQQPIAGAAYKKVMEVCDADFKAKSDPTWNQTDNLNTYQCQLATRGLLGQATAQNRHFMADQYGIKDSDLAQGERRLIIVEDIATERVYNNAVNMREGKRPSAYHRKELAFASLAAQVNGTVTTGMTDDQIMQTGTRDMLGWSSGATITERMILTRFGETCRNDKVRFAGREFSDDELTARDSRFGVAKRITSEITAAENHFRIPGSDVISTIDNQLV